MDTEFPATWSGENPLRLLEQAVAQSPVSVVITDAKGTIVFVNPCVVRLTGYARDELVGRHIRLMKSGYHNEDFYHGFWRQLRERGEWLGEFHNRNKDGRMFWERAHISAVKNSAGAVTHYLAVKEDITEKKRQMEELSQAKVQAEAAVRMKDAFLANMSHELRTPLNAINGITQTLLEQDCPEAMRPSLELVRRAGQDLLAIIQEVLCYSGMQAGRVVLDKQSFGLLPLMQNALQLVAETAREKPVVIDYLLGPQVPAEWEGDSLRLQQILVNLLGNAVKFTERGRVRLSVQTGSRSCGRDLWVFVSDTGIGIPREALGSLFKPFSQADQSITRRFGGTGLGLAISRSLARLMGGDIRVRTRIGRGTTFLLTLPRKAVGGGNWLQPLTDAGLLQGRRVSVNDPQPMRRRFWERVVRALGGAVTTDPAQAEGILDLSKLPRVGIHGRGGKAAEVSLHWPVGPCELVARWSESLLGTKVPVKTDPRRSPRIGERIPLHILIADDIRTNLETLRIMLRHLGYAAVTSVDNGKKAVEAAQATCYDLVILDLHMPIMDGVTAAREIRRSEGVSRKAKLVALTASTLDSDREQCFSAGMDDFLMKPAVPATLVALVEKHFSIKADISGPAPACPCLQSALTRVAQVPWLEEERLTVLGATNEEPAPDLLIALMQTVWEDLTAQLDQVRQSCVKRDSVGLTEVVHGIKGAALTAGWSRLGRRATEVVAELRKGVFSDWSGWPDELASLIEGSRAAWLEREKGVVKK